MINYKPIMRGRRRSFVRSFITDRMGHVIEIGNPKYEVGDKVGFFEIIRYEGHSLINKRNAHTMSKAQHWYRCKCTCGTEEHRSQQELIDPRRQQMCYKCRNPRQSYEE